MSWDDRCQAATECPSCGRSDEHDSECIVLARKESRARLAALIVVGAFAAGAVWNLGVRREFLDLGGWVVAAVGCVVATWALRHGRS